MTSSQAGSAFVRSMLSTFAAELARGLRECREYRFQVRGLFSHKALNFHGEICGQLGRRADFLKERRQCRTGARGVVGPTQLPLHFYQSLSISIAADRHRNGAASSDTRHDEDIDHKGITYPLLDGALVIHAAKSLRARLPPNHDCAPGEDEGLQALHSLAGRPVVCEYAMASGKVL